MSELGLQLSGHRLTTAEILYHMPDHPHLLQSFVWQFMDSAPGYPKLTRFLRFWDTNIEGRIHSVKVAGKRLIGAAEIRSAVELGRLH
jgi:uncharacterized protein Usg